MREERMLLHEVADLPDSSTYHTSSMVWKEKETVKSLKKRERPRFGPSMNRSMARWRIWRDFASRSLTKLLLCLTYMCSTGCQWRTPRASAWRSCSARAPRTTRWRSCRLSRTTHCPCRRAWRCTAAPATLALEQRGRRSRSCSRRTRRRPRRPRTPIPWYEAGVGFALGLG